jgi:hypothetical protein
MVIPFSAVGTKLATLIIEAPAIFPASLALWRLEELPELDDEFAVEVLLLVKGLGILSGASFVTCRARSPVELHFDPFVV